MWFGEPGFEQIHMVPGFPGDAVFVLNCSSGSNTPCLLFAREISLAGLSPGTGLGDYNFFARQWFRVARISSPETWRISRAV
jgi:hypothetical protein